MSTARPDATATAHFGRWLVRGLVRFYYPRIEIEGGDRLPAAGPLLLAANHPNSLMDPVILGIVVGRPVRLLAKAPLFELPVFGRILGAAGIIPAYRGERVFAGLIAGLDDLRSRHRLSEDDLRAGRRSYYNPSDDDEIHRLLSTFLALRSSALRLAWN